MREESRGCLRTIAIQVAFGCVLGVVLYVVSLLVQLYF